MPKERVQKKSRMHKEIQKEGINFNKEFGQHILKNPLILASMVEKVSFSLKEIKRFVFCID
jgi:18S rRNA (adenine1779-N6/adenine1780-N6)-dimethyltransferase